MDEGRRQQILDQVEDTIETENGERYELCRNPSCGTWKLPTKDIETLKHYHHRRATW